MIKTFCKSEYKDIFSDNGLSDFEDFMHYQKGEIVNKNTKRDVLQFSLETDSGEKTFFMKRFYKPHFKDMLFTWRVFGKPCSQALCEWNNADILLENEIDTYKPVCFGEHKICVIERESFLVTEKLDGVCLTDFISKHWDKMNDAQKENILTAAAQTSANIHNSGINFPDLYIWHFFITPTKTTESEDYKLAVIDLHRMEHNTKSEKKLLQNIGRLIHSMIDRYFTQEHKDMLIRQYLRQRQIQNAASAAGYIRKYSDFISRRRNPKKY